MLAEFGFSKDEIGELKRDKVVVRARTLSEIGTQYLALRLAKPDAGPPTIRCDKLDAGLFERGFDFRQSIEPNSQFAFHRLNALNGLQRDVSGLGEFCLAEPQYRASPANLTGRKHFVPWV